jgi:hypothetical protein
MKRHALAATLTSAGDVSIAWVPGPAEALTGAARWREVWCRFRKRHGRAAAVRLTFGAWRNGITLSGPRICSGVVLQDREDNTE